MPLARIDVAPADAHLAGPISDAVQESIVQTIGVPADDRFHLVTSSQRVYDRHYSGVNRSDRTIFIEITLRGGRTIEQKKALYAMLAERVSACAGIGKADVFVVLRENGAADWSFGDGVMQYERLAQARA